MASTSDEDSPPALEISPEHHESIQGSAGVGTYEQSSPAVVVNADANLSDDTTDSSASSSDRPNRFLGPSSTYRSHIQSERALLASLDQQRGNDLSIHLYNAHALKARLRDPDIGSSGIKSYHAKKRWIKPNPDGSLPWHPKDKWTAWPLPPEHVPRQNENFGVPIDTLLDADGPTYWMRGGWTPGKEMREETVALMLRRGKEQWQARVAEEVVEEASSADESDADSDVVMKTESDAEVAKDEDDEDAIDQLLQSQHVEPAFLADDDEAAQILDPMVHHIMSKVDDLLIGLQKSNEGRQHSARSKSRSQSRRRRSRSRARSKSPSHGIIDEDTDIHDTRQINNSNIGDLNAEEHRAEDPPTQRPKRKRPLNLRDWSEVLAIASLTGWDPAVVQRAAKRCSDLFGETVGFSLLDTTSTVETTAANPAHADRTRPPNGKGPVISKTSNEDSGKWRYCTVESCKRKDEPFREVWRWRDHLKRVHKYSKEQIERLESTTTPPAPKTEPIDVEENFIVNDDGTQWRFCPVETCKRKADPFDSAWRWREHLKRAHGYTKADIEKLEAAMLDEG